MGFPRFRRHSSRWVRHGTIRQGDVAAGLHSGNSFTVLGGLINELDFQVVCHPRHGSGVAAMGETLKVRKGEKIEVRIRIKSPASNNCKAGVNSSEGFGCEAYPPGGQSPPPTAPRTPRTP